MSTSEQRMGPSDRDNGACFPTGGLPRMIPVLSVVGLAALTILVRARRSPQDRPPLVAPPSRSPRTYALCTVLFVAVAIQGLVSSVGVGWELLVVAFAAWSAAYWALSLRR